MTHRIAANEGLPGGLVEDRLGLWLRGAVKARSRIYDAAGRELTGVERTVYIGTETDEQGRRWHVYGLRPYRDAYTAAREQAVEALRRSRPPSELR